MESIVISRAREEDFDQIWPIFHQVVKTGDTYVYRPNITKDEAKKAWMPPTNYCYIAKCDNRIVGTYIIKANQPDLGSHIANASFMVDPNLHGKGIGKRLAKHALSEAKKLGFQAMQFNIVISTNVGAIKLWENFGFHIIGTIPKAFQHQEQGFVDAHIMYKELK